MNKIIGAFCVGGFAILLSLCWVLGKQVRALEVRNEEMSAALVAVNNTLKLEQERFKIIENTTAELMSKDHERQARMEAFGKRLGVLAQQNKAYRDVLSVVIPDALLSGLRSFNPSGGVSGDDNP